MTLNSVKIGKHYETIIGIYLKEEQYEIIAENYRYRHLEIDLIGVKEKTLIFFEVKYRKLNANINPYTAITKKKQRNIMTCARAFLKTHLEFSEYFCQYDVVFVIDNGGAKEIKHIKQAFWDDWTR
jgi:putative endonuclease